MSNPLRTPSTEERGLKSDSAPRALTAVAAYDGPLSKRVESIDRANEEAPEDYNHIHEAGDYESETVCNKISAGQPRRENKGKALKIAVYGAVNSTMAIPALYGYAAIIFRCDVVIMKIR